jgi:formylglycine-generating enzyme required for sulfatase activity
MKRIVSVFMMTLFISVAISQTTGSKFILPEMVYVEGGTFKMGSDQFYEEEKPVHNVTVNSFSIGKYEVTVGEFKAFCDATGYDFNESCNDDSYIKKTAKHPIALDFPDHHEAAVLYCNWLSEVTGKKYRLPTEAEWEYAARGGNKSKNYLFAGSDDIDEVGWTEDNSGGAPKPVGLKKPNELGIYDMSGNLSEVCRDWQDDKYYSVSPSANPKGPMKGEWRVSRGGSYFNVSDDARVTSRKSHDRKGTSCDYGFRLVLAE